MNFYRRSFCISEKGFISRRKLEILAILAILLVVPLTVLVSQQQQETRQRASQRMVVGEYPSISLNAGGGNATQLSLGAGTYRLEGVIQKNQGEGFGSVQIDTYITNATALLLGQCPDRNPTEPLPATGSMYCRTIGFTSENANGNTYSGGVDFLIHPSETATLVQRAVNANVTMQNVKIVRIVADLPTPTSPASAGGGTASGFLSLNKETCPLSPNCRVVATWYYTNAQLPALEVWYSTNVSNKYYQRVQQDFDEGSSNARTFTLTEPGFYTFRLLSNRSSASPTTLQEKTVVTVGSTTAAPTQTPLPTTAQTLTPIPLPTVTSTPTLPATSVYCGRVRNPTSTTRAKTGYVDIFVDDVRNAILVFFTARLGETAHIYSGARQGNTNTWKGRVNLAEFRGAGTFHVAVTAHNGNNNYTCGNGDFTRTEEGAPAALEIPTAPSPTPTPRLSSATITFIWPSPASDNQDVNIDFTKNSQTNVVNLVIDDQEGYDANLVQRALSRESAGDSISWPSTHSQHTPGRHTIAIRPYYCTVVTPTVDGGTCTPGLVSASQTITISALPTNTPVRTATSTPTPAPVIGDVDGNRCLDNRDFYAWQNAYNQQQVPSSVHPDLNNDGHVDLKDYNIWYRAKRDLLGPLCQS